MMNTVSKDFTVFVPSFKDYLAAKGRSISTITSYSSDVRLFLAFLQEYSLTHEDLTIRTLSDYRTSLIHEGVVQENSIRRKIISIKQFFSFLVENKTFATNPFVKTVIPARDDSRHYKLAVRDLQSVLMHLQGTTDLQSLRNLAIIHLLAFEGVKATELTRLEWRHCIREKFSALLHITGEKKRVIRLQSETTRVLNLYRHKLNTTTTGTTFMFSGTKGPGGVLTLTTLTRHGLQFLLQKLAVKAKVTSLSPERLRHHAIKHLLLQQGRTASEVMAHLGLKRIGKIKRHDNKLTL